MLRNLVGRSLMALPAKQGDTCLGQVEGYDRRYPLWRSEVDRERTQVSQIWHQVIAGINGYCQEVEGMVCMFRSQEKSMLYSELGENGFCSTLLTS